MGFVAEEDLLSCVHCGFCLEACPTYMENALESDSPRGRILLIRALEEGRLEPDADIRRHLDSCLGCRACEPACPAGVPYGALIEATRPFLEKTRPLPARLMRRTLSSLLTRQTPRRVAALLLRPALHTMVKRLAKLLPLSPLAYLAALPTDKGGPLPRVLEAHGTRKGTVLLLEGCVAETFFRSTNRATARLLAYAGFEVLIPEGQGCCGALPLDLGNADTARTLARSLADFAAANETDWIIPTASGCGSHLSGLGHFLGNETAAAAVAKKVRDPLSLLAEVGLPDARIPLPERVAVHDPCHLIHAQGVCDEVRSLLLTIPEIELVPLEESDVCCGSAGTYNLTQPDMAGRLQQRKVENVLASGAAIIAAANPGCLLQIRAGLLRAREAISIEHPLELLARAHGLLEDEGPVAAQRRTP